MPSDNEQTISLQEAIALAIRLQQTGRLDEAESIYRKILDVIPEQPDALHFLGVLKYQHGAGEEAVTLIRRAIAICPEHADAYNNLGNVLKQLERFEEAMSAYQKVIALQPEHADGHNNLGIMLRYQDRLDEAVAAYRQAIACNPRHADAYYNLGNALVLQDRDEEAIVAYRQTIAIAPNHLLAHKQLGTELYRIGKSAEAVEVYQDWLRLSPNHPVALHMLAACSGEEVPARASEDYVRSLFDQFGRDFDEHLSRLRYRAPELVADAVAAHFVPEPTLHLLDAGCGTGLCGALLRPYAWRLIGVDLSSGMLRKASERALYDELVEAELTAFLATCRDTYDLIVSADTLVYFGDLAPVCSGVAAALRPKGCFVFTVERLSDDEVNQDYCLTYSGRYSHSEAYLRHTLTAAGFNIISMAAAHLRLESGYPVMGLVVVARLR